MISSADLRAVEGTDYFYDQSLMRDLVELRDRVSALRDRVGKLTPEFAQQLREIFRIKNIYETNAIEGSTLTLGETELVVREGLTILGKPLEDQLAAKNMGTALDFFERLAQRSSEPVRAIDVRNIHKAVLSGINDTEAGKYRSVEVRISGSDFSPPPPERVHTEMERFTQWLRRVTDPASPDQTDPLVLACAAHAWFVYIHPFVDGNGRTARLIMNLILIRKGYPLAVITDREKQRYYEALEISQTSDLTAFVRFMLEIAQESMDVYEKAAGNQEDLSQFAEDFAQRQKAKISSDYQVFEAGMQLLKNYFAQAVERLNDAFTHQAVHQSIRLKVFGTLDFEKYQMLKSAQSAKRTWFFRLDFFKADAVVERFVFFFGYSSEHLTPLLEGKIAVTLHTAVETIPFFYERLVELQHPDHPDLCEVAFLPAEQKYLAHKRVEGIKEMFAEEIAQEFIQQVFDRLVK